MYFQLIPRYIINFQFTLLGKSLDWGVPSVSFFKICEVGGLVIGPTQMDLAKFGNTSNPRTRK
jgi:hypothetical protein